MNGIFVGGEPFVHPISRWQDNDHGLEVGRGSYLDGSLTIETTKRRGLVQAKVVDRDDDDVVVQTYPNIGALLDTVLGRQEP
jgi:hypothetical protein